MRSSTETLFRKDCKTVNKISVTRVLKLQTGHGAIKRDIIHRRFEARFNGFPRESYAARKCSHPIKQQKARKFRRNYFVYEQSLTLRYFPIEKQFSPEAIFS